MYDTFLLLIKYTLVIYTGWFTQTASFWQQQHDDVSFNFMSLLATVVRFVLQLPSSNCSIL